MLHGELYNGMDPELLALRLRAKDLLYEIDKLRPSELGRRWSLLKELIPDTGENFYLEPPFKCDYGTNITIGNNVFINYNCVMLDCAHITIGNNVLIAPNVSLYAATHPTDSHTRVELGLEYALPISIGNNVWIGGNVSILPGVSIGDNSVIGTGSVVTRDIPPCCIAVGNPCRVIKKTT